MGIARKLIVVLRMWKNPLGLRLAAIHATILFAVLAFKQPMPESKPCQGDKSTLDSICFDPWTAAGVSVFARRPFHLSYEALPVKALMTADLPAFLVMELSVGRLLLPLETLSREAESYVAALCWFVFGSFEWWVIGVCFSMRKSR